MTRRRASLQAFSLFSFQDIITSVTGIIVLILLVLSLELVDREYGSPSAQNETVRKQAQAALDATRKQIAELEQNLASGEFDNIESLSPAVLEAEKRELQTRIAELSRQSKLNASQLKALEAKVRAERESLSSRSTEKAEISQLEEEVAEVDAKLKTVRDGRRLIYNPSETPGKTAWILQLEPDRILVSPAGKSQVPLLFEGSNQSRIKTFVAWSNESLRPQDDYFLILVKPQAVALFHELHEKLISQGFKVAVDLIGADQDAIDPVTGAGF